MIPTGEQNVSLAERVQRSSFGPIVRSCVSVMSYPIWRSRGARPPAPPHVKRRMLAHFARRFHPDVFVETGTYRGDTVAKMLDLVPRVVSIELDPSLARLARRRFARDSKVTIIEGDSADELPKIVSELRKPSMFWLDGHFSGGVTADPGTSPIMRELATVLGTKQPHLILVDDIRLFDGTAGYPTLEDVLAFVAATRDDVVAHTEVDVLRIIPSAFE